MTNYTSPIYVKPSGEIRNYMLALYPMPEGKTHARFFLLNYSALVEPYQAALHLCEKPSQLMNLFTLPYISLEMKSKYTTSIEEIELPEKAVYVVGNTKCPLPCNIITPPEVLRVHIDTLPLPEGSDLEWTMYGHQALAIALHEWRRQHANL